MKTLINYALKNRTLILLLCIITTAAGIKSYYELGKLKDPTFTIQTAIITTMYPGASADTVENQVTEVIEKAVQDLGTLKAVRSKSAPNLSTVYVDLKSECDVKTTKKSWRDLRDRINDIIPRLPPGAKRPFVYDQFGDTYGVFLALTGNGYSYTKLKKYANFIQARLNLCYDVAKVKLYGIQPEVIDIEISKASMLKYGFSPQIIFHKLQERNTLIDTGNIISENKILLIDPSGIFNSVNEIKNIPILVTKSGHAVHLNDIAKVTRKYMDPPLTLMRYNETPAIGIGVSTVEGGNAVFMGKAVRKKIKQLEKLLPKGLKLNVVNYQSDEVQSSINEFIINLLEAIVIVFIVLLFSMGCRSGLIIGSGLLLTILATFVIMSGFNITLQQVSLAALIIALGMLVDNSVVVVDGANVQLQHGKHINESILHATKSTAIPLLIATLISVVSFLPIYMAKSITGIFCSSLFKVEAISLLFSWIAAIFIVPVFCVYFLKIHKKHVKKNPFDGPLYRIFKKCLAISLRFRWPIICTMFLLLAVSIWGFTFVKISFIPKSNTPHFTIDYWLPQGTTIKKTSDDARKIEKYVSTLPGVKNVSSCIGSGPLRFNLSLNPVEPNPSYAFLVVNTKNDKITNTLIDDIILYLKKNYPDSTAKVDKFQTGPAPDFQIEARFSGPDPIVLKKLAAKTKLIMNKNPNALAIRDDWQQNILTWKPKYSQNLAARSRISRTSVAMSLKSISTTGYPAGLYRKDDLQIPILIRTPKLERFGNNLLESQPVFGSNPNESSILSQATNGSELGFCPPFIWRRNRIKTITIQCNAVMGVEGPELLSELRPKIEKIKLPPGYTLGWGGLYDIQKTSNDSVAAEIPLALILMLIFIFVLFSNVRQPLIIIMTLPLAIIGITCSMLIANKSFGFMAILGAISLIGMMIRNAVVLIDQINISMCSKQNKYKALIEATVLRIRPVFISSCTTALGMIPLISSDLFGGMAVTIMGGLMFSTVLTLIYIPVLYAVFYRIKINPKFQCINKTTKQ